MVSTDSTVLASAWDHLNVSQLGPAFATASTLLGVTALGYTGQLIEIDLTASLPEDSHPPAHFPAVLPPGYR